MDSLDDAHSKTEEVRLLKMDADTFFSTPQDELQKWREDESAIGSRELANHGVASNAERSEPKCCSHRNDHQSSTAAVGMTIDQVSKQLPPPPHSLTVLWLSLMFSDRPPFFQATIVRIAKQPGRGRCAKEPRMPARAQHIV